MQISELKTNKEKLEHKIKTLIVNFAIDNHVDVSDVRIDFLPVYKPGGEHKQMISNVNITLDI